MNRVPAPHHSVQLVGARTLPTTIMPFMQVISIVRNRNTSTYEVATTLMGYAPFPLFFDAYYTNISKVHCKLLLVREILRRLNVLCIQYGCICHSQRTWNKFFLEKIQVHWKLQLWMEQRHHTLTSAVHCLVARPATTHCTKFWTA